MKQDTKVHESINSFPLEENGYPNCENPASILPYSTGTFFELDNVDLLQLVRDLQDRCDRQDAELSALRNKIDSLEKQQLIDLNRTYGFVLERTKSRNAATTDKTVSHLDELQLYLQAIKRRGAYAAVDFKEAARVLKLSKRRLLQLRPTIEADNRFAIQKRRGKHYICLGYGTR